MTSLHTRGGDITAYKTSGGLLRGSLQVGGAIGGEWLSLHTRLLVVICIADEPTTGLDPASRRQVWEVIENVKEERSVVWIGLGRNLYRSGEEVLVLITNDYVYRY